MRFRVKNDVYELSIDEVYKKHEFYSDAGLALESAMDDIFEGEIRDGLWLTQPVPLNIPIHNIYYWRVLVMCSEGIVKEHRIKIRRCIVLDRA